MPAKFYRVYIAELFIAFLVFALQLSVSPARAAGLTVVSDTLSRQKAATASDHDIRFRSPSGMSSSTITVDFNTAGFSSGSTAFGDIDFYYGSSQAQVNGSCSSSCANATLAASAAAATWGAAFSSNTLTLTYPTSGGTAVATNDYLRIIIGKNATGGISNNQITNPSAGDNKIITITMPSDSGELAVSIIAADQITVSATVDPTLAFSVNNTSLSFGSWTNSTVTRWATTTTGATSEPASGNPVVLQVSTNAVTGLAIQIKDEGSGAAAGLYAGAITNLIAATGPSTVADSTESYAAYAKNAASGLTILAGFQTGGTTALTRTFQDFVTASTPVNAKTVDLALKAAITNTTKAGVYADTLTLICTGNF